jgi:hypothetical protein
MSSYHVATTRADQPLSAAGWRMRFLADIGDGWYAGGESDLAYFDGPQLTGTSTDGAVARTVPVTSRGQIDQIKPVIGKRGLLGRWAFAGELAPGMQLASFTSRNVPNYVVPWTQSWYVLEAHAVATAWLTPRVTMGLETSIDLVRTDRTQVGLLLGLHFDTLHY